MFEQIETPALLIDMEIMERNLREGQAYADAAGVALRPHTKTHKSVVLALRQEELGARGITVAKVGEAEVMAAGGLMDIFIAHHVVGAAKLARLRKLAEQGVRLAVSVDHIDQAKGISAAFADAASPLDVMLEVDTGLHRSGLQPGAPVLELARAVQALPAVAIRGIFTHEGHTYGAADVEGIRQVCREVQEAMVATSRLLKQELGIACEVSIGSTPTILAGAEILDGITEIRPGTYIFNDLGMAGVVGDQSRCAATILATVTTVLPDRVILDAGSKTLAMDTRSTGVCRTPAGHGYVVGKDAVVSRLSEEHGVVVTAHPERFRVGEKVRIIPNHVCVTVNLAQEVLGVQNGEVVAHLTADAKGRLQ